VHTGIVLVRADTPIALRMIFRRALDDDLATLEAALVATLVGRAPVAANGHSVWRFYRIRKGHNRPGVPKK